MKIWCYDDPQEWGKDLFNAASEKGMQPELFYDPHLPDRGFAFYHMHHHPQFRKMHKHAVQRLALRRDLMVLPTPRAADLFDDKVAQAKHLAKWMPNTLLFYSPSMVRNYIEHHSKAGEPLAKFWSKSAEGTNGHNVRLVTDPEVYLQEVRNAFSDRGIKMQHGQRQIGYLLWQEHVPDDGYSYRVITVGRKRLVQKRYTGHMTGESPFRRAEAINYMNTEVEAVLAFADRFFLREGFTFGSVDIVRHKVSGQWFVLGFDLSWNLGSYQNCRFITGTEVGAARGADIWHVMLDELEHGSLGEFQSTAA